MYSSFKYIQRESITKGFFFMFIYKDLIFDSKNEETEERAESDDLISDENPNIGRQEEDNYPNLQYIN